MTVTRCHVCEQNQTESRRLAKSGFAGGQDCPICLQPTCRHHLVKVRWRWRTPQRELSTALICRECHRTYAHRSWDPINRDWIS